MWFRCGIEMEYCTYDDPEMCVNDSLNCTAVYKI